MHYDPHTVFLIVPHFDMHATAHTPHAAASSTAHAPLRPPEQQPHDAALSLFATPDIPRGSATATAPLLAAYYFAHTGKQP